jgi:hypothetical protein
MSDDVEKALDARYRRHFGRIAGYLPKDRESVDEWQRSMKHEIEQARLRGERKKPAKSGFHGHSCIMLR